MELADGQSSFLVLKCGHAFHQKCIRTRMQKSRTWATCHACALESEPILLRLKFEEHPEFGSLNKRIEMKEAIINDMIGTIRTMNAYLTTEKENTAALARRNEKLESEKNTDIAKLKNRMRVELKTIKTSQEDILTKITDLQLEFAFLAPSKLKSDVAELITRLKIYTRKIITKSLDNIPDNVNLADPERKVNMCLKRKNDEISEKHSTKHIKRLPDMPTL